MTRTTEFCLLCTAMLIENWGDVGHYLVFLIFPMAVIVVRLKKSMTDWRLLGLALLILALNVLDLAGNAWVERKLVLVLITDYIPVVGLVALWGLFAAWIKSGADSRLKRES